MHFIQGITYQLRGLRMAVGNPRLLMLGLARLAIVILLTAVSSAYILTHAAGIAQWIWTRPESPWIVWLWVLFSWLTSLFLVVMAALLSYLVAQIFFSVWIMDLMSRITEKEISGQVLQPHAMSFFPMLLYLIRQEIPRATIPVALTVVIMTAGWLTPLGPVVAALSSIAAVTFLAWDNTDLTPARRMIPFGDRLKFLVRRLSFHVGFGLLFLVPVANIVFLSFAPVGATLYFIERGAPEHDQ